jgi:hypothetical protein
VGESLYGKFAKDMVLVGFIFSVIVLVASLIGGWMIPQGIIFLLYLLSFMITTLGIVLGIVGIIKDDLRENAIRALIAGIILLIVGIVFMYISDFYIGYVGELMG